jgi:nucleoside phosphorylase
MSPDACRPCLVFAVNREAMFVRRALPFRRRFPAAPCRADGHADAERSVLLVETGIGIAAVTKALAWVLSGPYRPPFVLSAGFSGALIPHLRVGDLILADEVRDVDGPSWPTTWPVGATDLSRGRLLTTTHLVGDPQEKRQLGERFGAAAVDMETAVVARLCAEAGMPFGCLRVISDDVDTPLSPALLGVLGGGRIRPLGLAAALLRRPSLARELIRLGRDTHRGARRLSEGLLGLLRPAAP